MVIKYILFFVALFMVSGICSETRAEEELFLMVETDVDKMYVKSEIVVGIKLYDRMGTAYGTIATPKLDCASGCSIRALALNPKRKVFEFGREYHILEYKYAVFIEKPGKYILSNFVFTGSFEGKKVRITADAMDLDILPPPEDFKGPWRSAKELTVKNAFNIKEDKVTVGDSIRRAIVFNATGAEGRNFADIELEKPVGARIYKSPPQKTEHVTRTNVMLEVKYSAVYVPQEAGVLVIPEMEVKWFDLRERQARTIKLPHKRFEVLPLSIESETKKADGQSTIRSFRQAYSLILIFGLCLGAFLFLKKIKTSYNLMKAKRDTWRDLKNACYGMDAKKALDLCLRIMNEEGDRAFTTMAEVEQFLDDEAFTQRAEELKQFIFNTPESSWRGKMFYKAFISALGRKKVAGEKKSFPELYPFN